MVGDELRPCYGSRGRRILLPRYPVPHDCFLALIRVEGSLAYYEGGGELHGTEHHLLAMDEPLPLFVAHLLFGGSPLTPSERRLQANVDKMRALLSGVPPGAVAAAAEGVARAEDAFRRELLGRLQPDLDLLTSTPNFDTIWVCSPEGFLHWKDRMVQSPEWGTVEAAQQAAAELNVSRERFRPAWRAHIGELLDEHLIRRTSSPNVKNPRYEMDLRRIVRILTLLRTVPHPQRGPRGR